jgi:hypothetical protein
MWKPCVTVFSFEVNNHNLQNTAAGFYQNILLSSDNKTTVKGMKLEVCFQIARISTGRNCNESK